MREAYTLHKPLRRKFPRNLYTVNNLFDVWECDLVFVQVFSKFNDNDKYLLKIITHRSPKIENWYSRNVST